MRSFNNLINLTHRRNTIDFQKCENITLGLLKLIKTQVIEQTRLKREFWEAFRGIRKSNYDNILSKIDKINEDINSFEKQGYRKIYPNSLKLKTQSRLIIGLGSAHVLETSITLHHIYGIPYIPASALKGVCRMVAFWKIAEAREILNNENSLNDLQKKFYGELVPDEDILKYQLLFGAQNFKGLLLFLDAYPEIDNNQEIFDLDIMNVHYPSYYEGKSAPGDWENPRPIVFLTLKEGIKFNFNVLFDEFRANEIMKLEDKQMKKLNIPENAKSKIKEWEDDQSQLENEIRDLLEKALKEFGIGAKTRLGYGIFE